MNISIKNLSKVYDGRFVLDKLNFEIQMGKRALILGPNGAGKTTLIRILNLLEPPTEGEIYFDGENIQDMREKWVLRRKMAVVFQRPAVFNTSVSKNIAIVLKVRGEKKAVIDKKVAGVLKTFGLRGHAQKNAGALSGGEKQLLAIARAVVIEPDLLLLDEPTSNLDVENTELAWDVIKNTGSTIIITSPGGQDAGISDRTLSLS